MGRVGNVSLVRSVVLKVKPRLGLNTWARVHMRAKTVLGSVADEGNVWAAGGA